jgi:hypothetical protein
LYIKKESVFLQRKKRKEQNMETITLGYDAKNPFASSFINTALLSNVFSVVGSNKSVIINELQEAVNNLNLVRKGKMQARSANELLYEL